MADSQKKFFKLANSKIIKTFFYNDLFVAFFL